MLIEQHIRHHTVVSFQTFAPQTIPSQLCPCSVCPCLPPPPGSPVIFFLRVLSLVGGPLPKRCCHWQSTVAKGVGWSQKAQGFLPHPSFLLVRASTQVLQFTFKESILEGNLREHTLHASLHSVLAARVDR